MWSGVKGTFALTFLIPETKNRTEGSSTSTPCGGVLAKERVVYGGASCDKALQ